jgi:hypothetical protein
LTFEVKGGSDLVVFRGSASDGIGQMGVTEITSEGSDFCVLSRFIAISLKGSPTNGPQGILSDWNRFIRVVDKIQSAYSTKMVNKLALPAGAADQYITQIFPH